jgi:hypothetical protein
MLRKDGFRHGFDDAAWERAKQEARQFMYWIAKKKGLTAYSDLVAQVRSVRMEPHDARLAHFLGEIATEDDESGLGLTTVVVVHKHGDRKPGPGFFELAELRGRDVGDIEACWVQELNAVYICWAKS